MDKSRIISGTEIHGKTKHRQHGKDTKSFLNAKRKTAKTDDKVRLIKRQGKNKFFPAPGMSVKMRLQQRIPLSVMSTGN